MEMWMDDPTVKTPWGFSLEQAFEAMRFKTLVENDTDPQNKYSPDRKEMNTVNLFGQWHSCRYPTCQNPRNLEKLCYHHRDKLVDARNLRIAQKKQRDKDSKEAYEIKRFRETRIAFMRQQMDAFEKASQRPIIMQARTEYRAAKALSGKRYTGPPRAGYVYRLYDAEQTLLYIGKTYSVKARLFGEGGHAKTKEWFGRALAVRITEYKTESDALVAEGFAIRREKPLYNVAVPAQKVDRSPRRVADFWEFVSAL